MAKEQDVNITENIVKIKDRTWRIQCFTDLGSDYTFEALRERLYLDVDGEIVRKELVPSVIRVFSQVKEDPEAIAMLAAIREKTDKWAEEDEAIRAAMV